MKFIVQLFDLPKWVNHNRNAFTDGSTIRDPPCDESLDVVPVPQSTGFEDGETPVKREEATPSLSNIGQE